MVNNLFLSTVDQASKAAEECPDQGEDDEVRKEYETHPPWLLGGSSLAPWRILLGRLWQQTGQKFLREPEGRGAEEGREGEMQSANKEGNNMKVCQLCEIQKISFARHRENIS